MADPRRHHVQDRSTGRDPLSVVPGCAPEIEKRGCAGNAAGAGRGARTRELRDASLATSSYGSASAAAQQPKQGRQGVSRQGETLVHDRPDLSAA